MSQIQSWIRRLKRKFTPLLPTRVYCRDLSKTAYEAYSDLIYDDQGKPHHFVIVIHKSFPALMKHMLIHEWAHVYSWQQGEYTEDHGPEWGLAMSRIYQFLIEE